MSGNVNGETVGGRATGTEFVIVVETGVVLGGSSAPCVMCCSAEQKTPSTPQLGPVEFEYGAESH